MVLVLAALAFLTWETIVAWTPVTPGKPDAVVALITRWRVLTTAALGGVLLVPPALLLQFRYSVALQLFAVLACLFELWRLSDAFAYNWAVWRFARLATSPLQLAFAVFATLGILGALFLLTRDMLARRAA